MKSLSIPNASELKQLFAARGVRPSRRRGQNFLVDAELMRWIAREAAVDRRDVVLEVGAGTGGLTGCLAECAGAVVAVEVDRKLHEIASERLSGLPNVRLLHADAMGGGDVLAPEVRGAVESALAARPGARFKVVANLPYCISTAFICAVLLDGPTPSEMVVTVQREVGDRICAAPDTEDYGYLSVVVQAVARPRALRRVSPAAFWPQPEVESSVLRIRPDAELRAAAGDLSKLLRTAGGLFRHRRKQLARSLLMAGLAADRESAARMLSAVGAGETDRCEQLTVAQFVRLAKLLS